MTGRALTASNGIARDPLIAALLGRPVKKGFGAAGPDDVVVGWGKKKNTRAAKRFAAKSGLPYWHLEDGFFSYLSHPALDGRRMSLVLDRTGIYYDATAPSDLENLLNRDDWITPDLIARAEAAIARIRRWRLSKYNQAPFDLSPALKARLGKIQGPKVLIVDQTFGDMSLTLGMSGDNCFADILQRALADYPDATILVKVHPDVLIGKKKSHFGSHILPDRVMLLADYVNPQALMAEVDHVYVATSQMGFEALITGKPVTCFGMPFYAGWGLTTDMVACPRRVKKRSLAELFAAACILYARYVDPFTHQSVELEDILDILVADKQLARPEGGRALAVGFSIWRRRFAHRFFGPGVRSVQHVRAGKLGRLRFEKDDMVVLWGRKHDAEAVAVPTHVPVWRMEDGFLRSVGLGSDYRRPSSLVLDSRGIYYDGTAPSDLEHFLATHEFDERELARGRTIRDRMLKMRVSKYNVGDRGMLDFRAKAGGRPVLLVPGQVETDSSIHFGSPVLKKNAALLEAVRAAMPDAYIIYKPHPDVVSGNRIGDVPKEILDRCVNETVLTANIVDCLEAVDQVHTMTSLTGFEALLRGVPVVVYGIPFYAGWGLTTDRIGPIPRRGRQLSVEALVYSLMCIYARYVRWPERESYSPEALILDIAAEAEAAQKAGAMAAATRPFRKAKYVIEALLG